MSTTQTKLQGLGLSYIKNKNKKNLVVLFICVYLFQKQKINTMKKANFYKAVSGYWIAEFPIKGQSKLRRMPVGNTNKELEEALVRYQKKGYDVCIK